MFTDLSIRTRAGLFTQLATLGKAGLPVDKAFGLLRLDSRAQPRVEVARKLLRGGNAAFAGEKSGLFTRLETTLVRAALLAGSPERTYQRLADYYTQRTMQTSAMKSRLVAPLFILIAAVFIQPLPGVFSGAIGIGSYLLHAVGPLVVIGGGVRLAMMLPGWFRHSPMQAPIDNMLPHLPLVGALHVRHNVRDFFESLALMLEAGIPLLDALPSALDTMENSAIRREFARIKAKIEKGATFAQAISGFSYIGQAHVVDFVKTGEESGTLPEMLFRHAAMETSAINETGRQISIWVPRGVYLLIVLWIAYGLITGPGVGPRLPAELR